ncbi:hypothetical protein WG906_01150 [Pedobacter sp. P351]|uniref:hypothetical protein n=1 Tax=Pedobacter superstes TaxID=3133441 RepID=UPI0030A9A70F
MEEKEQLGKSSRKHEAFYVEAAIDERGPQNLKIVPSYHQYLVYEDDVMLSCIQLNDDNEWEQIDGSFTSGAVLVVGHEIMRVKAR